MLKAVQCLVNDARSGELKSRYGNHSFEKINDKWYFRYHDSAVCIVDPVNKTVTYDHCGYEGFPSTERTINSYSQIFSSYEEVPKESGDIR